MATDVPIDTIYGLAPMQQGMLFNALFTNDPGMDVVQVVGDLHEEIDGPAFQRAWERAIDRHTILRTSFRWDGGEPLQQVHPAVRTPWEHLDLGPLDDVARERWLHDLLTADRRRGFELRQAPLLRVGLYRTGRSRTHVLVTFHHSVLDGRSLLLLLREVFRWYESPADTEPPAIPYQRYVAWHDRQDRSADELFWRELLRGLRSPTPLFGDRVFGPVAPGTGAHAEHDLELGEGLSAALRHLAVANGLTLNTLVQAAWSLVLARHADRREVVFGATRSVRRGTIDGAETMVGLFLNTLPVRVSVEGGERLLPWLRALRQQALAVRAHQHTALHQVQRWSDVPGADRLLGSRAAPGR